MFMKKILAFLMVLSMLVLVFQLATVAQPAAPIRVASLKGPTSMGLVKLMSDSEGKDTYEFTVAGAADEITPLIAKGEIDIALIPCNLASVLQSKTGGALRMAAINTLGVLYVVEDGDTVRSVQDLKGKTLLSTGKGTTPEYALNYVLTKNGIDPGADLTIDFRSEPTEVAALLEKGGATMAMLPQPFVTAALAQNPNLRVALSLTEEWDKVGDGSALVTGVVVMQKKFLEERPEDARAFMEAYQASTEFVNAHPAEVAPAIEALGIAKAQIAEKAIPQCNIVCITGDDMRQKAQGYLAALLAQNPEAVGGQLPDESFYAQP